MRRRFAIFAVVLMLMLPTLAALAYTAQIRTHHGAHMVYDPSGSARTCGAGETWRFRSYTWDFGPFDSTGTTTFQYATSSQAYTINRSGEHDGVTRTYNTGRGTIEWGSIYYFNLSGVGSGRGDIYCD